MSLNVQIFLEMLDLFGLKIRFQLNEINIFYYLGSTLVYITKDNQLIN